MKIELITKPEEVPIVQLRNPDGNDQLWMNIATIEFILDGVKQSIKPGFVTNLGSVPKLVRHIVDPADESMVAFIIHDYFYGIGSTKYSRKKVDAIMKEVARACGQDRLESWLAWAGVRLGGRSKFKKNKLTFLDIPSTLLEKICKDNSYLPSLEDYPELMKITGK